MRLTSPSADRNKDPILAAIGPWLPARGTVLEIASGSGQHIVHFARSRPDLDWQPSDPSAQARASIAEWTGAAGLPNLRTVLALDVTDPDWPPLRADAILCINMIHVAPWAATLGLLAHAAALLPPDGPLILYGPYRRAGIPTAPSNEAFDQDLRARDPAWGLRDLDQVTGEAAARGFLAASVEAMPANNLTVVFRRGSADPPHGPPTDTPTAP